jgi:DnaJ-class molecular chaperone
MSDVSREDAYWERYDCQGPGIFHMGTSKGLEEVICSACNGSGEGRFEWTTCSECDGSGVVLVEINEGEDSSEEDRHTAA